MNNVVISRSEILTAVILRSQIFTAVVLRSEATKDLLSLPVHAMLTDK